MKHFLRRLTRSLCVLAFVEANCWIVQVVIERLTGLPLSGGSFEFAFGLAIGAQLFSPEIRAWIKAEGPFSEFLGLWFRNPQAVHNSTVS
jgi:hypothetical protein